MALESHPRLNRSLPPRKILTAGGSLLDDTTEGLLQGFVPDEYGNPHPVLVVILIVSGTASNRYSVKNAATKGIASTFYIENPRLEGHNITIPLRIRRNDIYSFVLDLSADGYGATELVINAAANAQLNRALTTVVVVVVFFTLIDRASTIPNNTRGCQSGTWSAGQKKIRGTSTKLQ